MADFASVPTVELLTRAADAAGRAADLLERWAVADAIRAEQWRHELETVLLASGPDHWRAVELTFRRALERAETLNRPMALGDLRPLAVQVLRDLGEA